MLSFSQIKCEVHFSHVGRAHIYDCVFQVAMVERDDFASGTSGRSTKLVHGGIRLVVAALLKKTLSLVSSPSSSSIVPTVPAFLETCDVCRVSTVVEDDKHAMCVESLQ